ncbi:unannotated protein [freshwater metagenome]|uniref:Unannotated protein n=1 Tax=freshwater metagenome TaxID=449393 RepID=A0A6J7FL07_9ZZZZ|nr:hypothetical protein [Actinomycetota bacterium]
MSAFLVSREHVDVLVRLAISGAADAEPAARRLDFPARIKDEQGRWRKVAPIDDLQHADLIDPTDVGRILWAENARSVGHRYSDPATGVAGAPPAPGAMGTSSVRHPLTLRERAWLVAQLRTVRGRGIRPGDQVAIDAAAVCVAGVVLDDGGRVVDGPGVDAGSAGSLRVAVAAVERQLRSSRREAAREGAPRWVLEALRRDEQTVRLLRRVRNAAVRAERDESA